MRKQRAHLFIRLASNYLSCVYKDEKQVSDLKKTLLGVERLDLGIRYERRSKFSLNNNVEILNLFSFSQKGALTRAIVKCRKCDFILILSQQIIRDRLF